MRLDGTDIAVGEDVYYQTDGRGGLDYYLPAKVVVTQDNLQREGVERGDIPDLDSRSHVHLRVFSPGTDYVEHNVPHDPDGSKRSWRRPAFSERWPGGHGKPVA